MFRGYLQRCKLCRARVPRGQWDSWARRWCTGPYCGSCGERIGTEARERDEHVQAQMAAWLAQAPAYDPNFLMTDRERQKYAGDSRHNDAWLQELDTERAVKALTQYGLGIPTGCINLFNNDRASQVHDWPQVPARYHLEYGTITFIDAHRQVVPRRERAPDATLTLTFPPCRYQDSLLLKWHPLGQIGGRMSPAQYRWYCDVGSVYSQDGAIYVVWAPAARSAPVWG